MFASRNRRWSSVLSGLAATIVAGAAAAANPAGFYYNDHSDAPYTNIDDFKHPTAMLITGRCNRYNAHFKDARDAGAEVLAYIDPVDIRDSPSTCQAEFFTGAQLWPHKDKSGNYRTAYKKTKLADLSVGSSWADAVVAYVEKLMREGKVDGVMLDVVGGMLWGKLANWSDWPPSEKIEWTNGNVDLVRRLNDSRKRINPSFIIVNNGRWTTDGKTSPDPNVVYAGEQYVDGIVIEHHPTTNVMAVKFAGRTYGNAGAGFEHRRVIVISRTLSDAQAWTGITGVTHVALHPDGYDHAEPPVVTPTPLTDRPHRRP
jgi:hypothetical protein